MYVDDYRKLTDQQIKNVYMAYANIFNELVINEQIREDISGIIFENNSQVFTFKLYRPSNFQDTRLTYVPIEIVKIGKNKKTAIPVKIYGTTSGTDFNLMDSNIYDVDVYDSNIYGNSIIFDSNA